MCFPSQPSFPHAPSSLSTPHPPCAGVDISYELCVDKLCDREVVVEILELLKKVTETVRLANEFIDWVRPRLQDGLGLRAQSAHTLTPE